MHTLFEPGERGFLITDIGRLIHKAFEQRAVARGYSKFRWQILAYLSLNPGTMQVALANHMEVEPITLSRYLDRLEADGVLERRNDIKDRRVKRLYMTAKAQEQLRELQAIRDEIVTALYLQVCAEESERLKEVLSGVRCNLLEMMK